MKSVTITLTSFIFATSAFAECATPEDNLFTCDFDGGKKRVEICLIKTSSTPKVSYSYGPIGGTPELKMSSEFAPASAEDGYNVWYDEGQTGIWIVTGEQSYEVEYSSGYNGFLEGYLQVNKLDNETSLFKKSCDEGSITVDLHTLYDALDEAGWYYIYDSETTGWVDKKEIK